MPKDANVLKLKAANMFSPALAKEIISKIDEPAADIGLESIATFWQGDHLFDDLKTGTFHGRLSVAWDGMDSFIHSPALGSSLSYIASDEFQNRTITPKVMGTDGGSVPRILQSVSRKLSSWSYAPAFILHDWIFTAHKCGFAPDNNFTFPQSARLMAEAMKTLMVVGYTNHKGKIVTLGKQEDTLWLFFEGVSSSIALNLWNTPETVECMTQ